MLFKKMTLEDIPKIREYLYKLKTQSCDYTIGGMIMWRDYYHMEYQIVNNTFYSRLFDEKGNCFYNIPIGGDIQKAVKFLISEEKHVSFCTIPDTVLRYLLIFLGECKTTEQENFADYLYSSVDLKTLKGKKYSGQRNMIHQFTRENESWQYEEINDNNIVEIKKFLLEHYKIAENSTAFEIEEEKKVLEVLDNYHAYDFIGSLLRIGGEIVGFSIGEIVNDTLFVHIEKANKQIKGAYQMLVNLFAQKYAVDDIKYINREEDMGDIGLRTSKKSYHPFRLLKKYIIEVS